MVHPIIACCIKIILIFIHIKTLSRLLSEQKHTQSLLKIYSKCAKINLKSIEPQGLELPQSLPGRIDYLAAKALVRSKKAQIALRSFEDIAAGKVEEAIPNLSTSLTRCLRIVATMSGISLKQKEPLAYFRQLIEEFKKITDANGLNILAQLDALFVEKKNLYHDVSILYHAQTLIEQNRFSLDENREMLEPILKRYGITLSAQDSPQTLFQHLTATVGIVDGKLEKLKRFFHEKTEEIDEKLTIFETSTDRLAQEFSPQILEKPIHVTMVGVEYAGLIKVGGLSEALEGLSVAMKKQHPDNHVRLIFPKFSIIPEKVRQKLEEAPPKEYKDFQGNTFRVYATDIDGVECLFIEDPSFVLTKTNPNIYGPNEEETKRRFVKFSQLASDLIPQLGKTDIIHLHDWHVAGIAIKYKKDHLKEWEEGKTPPIVFTFHNNNRGAQGRFFHEVYHYDPIIQGLIQAGIASENLNAFIETLQIADSATTVSPSFAIESQAIDTGEGVSFATREAAQKGKLFGVINGSNPTRWNPARDSQLQHWKDPETAEPIDLTFDADSPNIVARKQLCKSQLAKWVKQTFPSTPFDETKPIVTFIGRFDSYQKGIDTLDAAMRATLNKGGQFVCMGSSEDPIATQILELLQKKYAGKAVLFIRDYKDPSGAFHYQQGNHTRQGIGSVVRASSDFVYIPSSFEPCGLVQFEGWLFGSLAIGSRVGGLADTIIPHKQDPLRWNGFLFDRKEKIASSVSSVITKALETWSSCTLDQKNLILSRIMKDGKKYSWSEAPAGYSPVQRYRFVYENAKKMARLRASSTRVQEKRTDLLGRYRILSSQQPKSELNIREEKYNALFKKQKTSLEKLEKAFLSLPEGIRKQISDPYLRDVSFREYERFGAHHSQDHTQFAVFAPGAKSVAVKMVDTGVIQPMSKHTDGSWSIDVPNIPVGTRYQYLVNGQTKLDPYGRQTVPSKKIGDPPCSVVTSSDQYEWTDSTWMSQRAQEAGQSKPMSMYEVYPTAWRKKDGHTLTYRELAPALVNHCKQTGYTHVELMGILDHPSEASWGYQVTGFFSPNSRMGSPSDLKYLIDYLHANHIGVALDFIPCHFAIDEYALNKFDGTDLFQPTEAALPFLARQQLSTWGTKYFDFKKRHVRDFLISSAAYWVEQMHVDALRVDAVRCCFLSEDPAKGRLFLKQFNSVIHKQFQGVQTIAEDLSGGLEISRPLYQNGLGFDMKWNITWMYECLPYFYLHPKDRKLSYQRIISSITADPYHNMVVAISHDNVKSGWHTLTDMAPGLSLEQKLANLRAFFGFMYTLPGKKLLFMGSDTASEEIWDTLIGKERGVDDLPLPESKRKIQQTLHDLNLIYTNNRAFYERDSNGKDLTWIKNNDPNGQVVAFRRTSANKQESFACFHNFTDTAAKEFVIALPRPLPSDQASLIVEIFNSDDSKYGGSGAVNKKIELVRDASGAVYAYKLQLPPLTTLIIRETA